MFVSQQTSQGTLGKIFANSNASSAASEDGPGDVRCRAVEVVGGGQE